MSASSQVDDGVRYLSLIFELNFSWTRQSFLTLYAVEMMIEASAVLRGGFTLTTLQKQSSVSMMKVRAVESIFSKSRARRYGKKSVKNCRQGHHELSVLDSTWAKAFIIPLVTTFLIVFNTCNGILAAAIGLQIRDSNLR
jgi:hypothetical protein